MILSMKVPVQYWFSAQRADFNPVKTLERTLWPEYPQSYCLAFRYFSVHLCWLVIVVATAVMVATTEIPTAATTISIAEPTTGTVDVTTTGAMTCAVMAAISLMVCRIPALASDTGTVGQSSNTGLIPTVITRVVMVIEFSSQARLIFSAALPGV